MTPKETLGNEQWLRENEQAIKNMLPKAWTNVRNISRPHLESNLKLLDIDWYSEADFARIFNHLEKIGMLLREGYTIMANPYSIFEFENDIDYEIIMNPDREEFHKEQQRRRDAQQKIIDKNIIEQQKRRDGIKRKREYLAKTPWINMFSVRLRNCLLNLGTVGNLDDLCNLTDMELLRTPNFGRKSLDELKTFLLTIGRNLNGRDKLASIKEYKKKISQTDSDIQSYKLKIQNLIELKKQLQTNLKKTESGILMNKKINESLKVSKNLHAFIYSDTEKERRSTIQFLFANELSNDEKKIIEEAFNWIDVRSKKVITERHNHNTPKKTLKEMGNDLGVTRERVRQIERKALWKLANILKMELFRKTN